MEYFVSNIEHSDLPEIMNLIYQQGWKGYDFNDLIFIINLSPKACFKVKEDNKIVGFIFSLNIERITYISFFLVNKKHRNYIYASILGKECMKQAMKDSELIVIYANKKAVNTYKRNNFIPLNDITRYSLQGDKNKNYSNVLEYESGLKEALLLLDRKCYGYDREKLVDEFLALNNTQCFVYKNKISSEIEGYAFTRKNKNEIVIGPLVADNDLASYNLLMKILYEFSDEKIIADSSDNLEGFLKDYNVSYRLENVSVTKMYFGNKEMLENERMLYIVGGHHFS